MAPECSREWQGAPFLRTDQQRGVSRVSCGLWSHLHMHVSADCQLSLCHLRPQVIWLAEHPSGKKSLSVQKAEGPAPSRGSEPPT